MSWQRHDAHDPDALERVRWEAEDTLDPVGRLAAQPRIARLVRTRRRPRHIAMRLTARERRQVIERRRSQTPERRAYRRLWMRRWRQTPEAKQLCELRTEVRSRARAALRRTT